MNDWVLKPAQPPNVVNIIYCGKLRYYEHILRADENVDQVENGENEKNGTQSIWHVKPSYK